MTGQRLDSVTGYDVTTGERLQDNDTTPRQRQDSFQDRPPPRNRSPSPTYNYSQQNNSTLVDNRNLNRSSSPQRDNHEEYSDSDDNDNNWPPYHTRRGDVKEQGYSDPGRYTQSYNKGGPLRRGMRPYRGALRDDQGGYRSRQLAITYPGYTADL